MTEVWRKGDKVRSKSTGEIVSVLEFQPYGFFRHEEGFTYLDEDGVRCWRNIGDYELIERANSMSENIKMTLSDGTTIEGTAEEIAKLQRLIDDKQTGETSKETEDKPNTYPKPAQVGDTIKIVNAARMNRGYDYDNGDIMTVITVDEVYDVIKTDKYNGYIEDREFEIIGRGDKSNREMSFFRAGRKVDDIRKGDIISTSYYEMLEVIDLFEKNIYPVGVVINGRDDGLQVKSCTLVCPVEKRTDIA